jgi:uncharacterized membrane protein
VVFARGSTSGFLARRDNHRLTACAPVVRRNGRSAAPQLLPRRVLRDTQVHHPAVLEEARQRGSDFQLRLADRITTFAGSMNFVYIHAVLFALSTFVMIGQNRQAAFQQAKADHDFDAQEVELKTNTQLTREIHTLTEELHRRLDRRLGVAHSRHTPCYMSRRCTSNARHSSAISRGLVSDRPVRCSMRCIRYRTVLG